MTSSETASLETLLSGNRELIDRELDFLLPPSTTSPTRIHEAIRWSVFAGGKRFRPTLLIASGQTFNASTVSLIKTACALEMIHTYSLIHDDLPSMDDDELRRGRPTCHVRFDEATAILAGDALQTFAIETIARDDHLDPNTRVQLVAEITKAAGTPRGMVAGQALDIAAEGRFITDSELEEIHRLKTGALISAAARCGAIIARANPSELDVITRYAAQLGLLFQITDDILDVTASVEDLGKTPGKDQRSQKATYPSLHGMEEAKAAAARAHTSACKALESLDHDTGTLKSIADYILNRTK